MISFSAPIADANGSMVFDEDQSKTRLDPPKTRASRTKCLNATSWINHSGVVDGDRTFTIIVRNATKAEYDFIVYLQNTYTTAILSCRVGVFSGVIIQPSLSGGTLTTTYMVGERLDA